MLTLASVSHMFATSWPAMLASSPPQRIARSRYFSKSC
jgi:hypothetical protein